MILFPIKFGNLVYGVFRLLKCGCKLLFGNGAIGLNCGNLEKKKCIHSRS